MARADEPPQFIGNLTPQLRRFMAASSSPPEVEAAPEKVWVAESFQVWTVALGEFRRETNRPLSQRAQWTGVWHLQLRRTADGPAFAFARWLEKDGEVNLRSLHVSPLAGEIDRAIQWIDENLPDDAWLVRLLEIPDLKLPMLWLDNSLESRFRILLGETRRSKKNLRATSLYSEAELRSELRNAVPIRGLKRGLLSSLFG